MSIRVDREINEKFIPDVEEIFQNSKKRQKDPSLRPRRNYLRAIARLFLFFIVSLFFILLRLVQVAFAGMGKRSGAKMLQLWSRVMNFLLGIRVKQEGIVPHEGVLLVSNHRSYIDITVIAQFIHTSFLAKAELQSWPVIGFGAKLANVLFVQRDDLKSRRESRENLRKYLATGNSIHVCPEGTTFMGPGILPFRPGVFTMASDSDVSVVPVALDFDDPSDAWVGDDTFIRHFFQAFSKKRVHVRLAFGPLMKGETSDKLREGAWSWIHNQIMIWKVQREEERLALLERNRIIRNPLMEMKENFDTIRYNLDTILAGLQYNPYRYEVIYRPGKCMTESQIQELTAKLRETTATGFREIPSYQVLTGRKEDFEDKVIALAWKQDGSIAGFCSTVILPVEGVGEVLHLGLTVVRPEDRSNGLTHILTSRAVKEYLLKHKPVIGKLWISNCAAVLSSLVNVAQYFEEIHPSPVSNPRYSRIYQAIAEAIDKYYREKIYISEEAVFDADNFVFRGSVKGTVFQKERNDTRYYHRNEELNDYYSRLMEFENGDEVLQIGYASTFAALKHMYNRSIQKLPFAKQVKQRPGSRISA